MFNNKKKQRKKDDAHFIIALAVVLFLCLIYFIFVASGTDYSEDKIILKKRPAIDEVNRIKNDNKDVVNAARNAALGKVRAIDQSDHIRGSAKAPVQLIVYGDFECPFSSSFSGIIKKVETEFAGKLAIAFRHFSLGLHANSMTAAIASECAAEQRRFWDMHDQLFLDNGNNNLNADQIKKDAFDLKMNTVKFNGCLDKLRYKDKVEAQIKEARGFGVLGTPGSFVNGEFLPGAVPFEDFIDSSGRKREGMKSVINRHLEKITKP